jgi:hypothetical protein
VGLLFRLRELGYNPERRMAAKQLEELLEKQVQQELDNTLIQEYLQGFAYRLIFRIVPVKDCEELPGEGWLK